MCYFVQRNMCFCTYQCLGFLAHLRKPIVSIILFVQTLQTTKPVSCDMCCGTVHLFGLFVLMLPIWLWSSVSVLGCNMWLVLLSVVVRHRSPIYVYICCFWLRGGWEGFDSPSSCLLLPPTLLSTSHSLSPNGLWLEPIPISVAQKVRVRSPLFPHSCRAVTFHLLIFTFAFLSVTNPFALITCFDVRLYDVIVLTFALTLYMYINMCVSASTFRRGRRGHFVWQWPPSLYCASRNFCWPPLFVHWYLLHLFPKR